MSSFRRLRTAVLSLASDEASFAKRGFRRGTLAAQGRLELVGATFLEGYHAALRDDEPETLAVRLAAIDAERQGFAFEGAAMGLTLLDHLLPWRHRLRRFLQGPAQPHVYMVHVGAGVAFARLPWIRRRLERALAAFDPLLGWLVVDGYGFHEGFFHWGRCAEGRPHPSGLSAYACRVFDQGLGRSAWFVEGADVTRISRTIGSFPPHRHSDLWAGVGLACTYAGGVEGPDIERLRDAAGAHRAWLAQGAAFAAKARQRAGNLAPHTELATQVLCGTSAETAAAITDEALAALSGLSPAGAVPAYESWRRAIHDHLSGQPTEGRMRVNTHVAESRP